MLPTLWGVEFHGYTIFAMEAKKTKTRTTIVEQRDIKTPKDVNIYLVILNYHLILWETDLCRFLIDILHPDSEVFLQWQVSSVSNLDRDVNSWTLLEVYHRI